MTDWKEYEYSAAALPNSKSGYRGVHWNKKTKRWIARITYFGRQIHLGSFLKLLDALTEAFYGAMRAMHRPGTILKER